MSDGMTRLNARVAVKNRRNAAANLLAHFRKEITVEEVLASRPIADPRTRSTAPR